MRRRSRLTDLAFSLMIFSLTTLPGCSDDGLGRRYKVTGTVTYKGVPMEKGLICFISPNADGRSSTGTISKGYYTLQTQEPGDGAFPGQYSVTITSRTPDLAAAAAEAKAKGNTAAYTPPDFTAKAYKKAPDEVPAKYGTVSPANPLKAEVKAESNTINFELVD
jgi:hypothetical protein